MSDARVIPIEGGRKRQGASSAVAAGAHRAGGERARRRRRTTPLLGELDAPDAGAGTTDDVVPQPREEVSPVQRPAGQADRHVEDEAAEKGSVGGDDDVTVSPNVPGRAGGGADQPGAPLGPVTAGPAPRDRPSGRRRAHNRPTPLAAEASRVGEDLAAQLPDSPVAATEREASDLEQKLAAALAFLRRRVTGDYEVDEFGFDAEFTDGVVLNLLRPLYRKWFRVEVRGIENIPAEGGALVVANHSGTIALDALMTQVAVHDEHPQHRHLRLLGADLVFSLPFVGDIARKSGSTLAANPDAERLLSTGELVGVWPEGFKGIGKPFSERYKLQRFGRGGFVSAALRTRTPIVPCSIVGAEEIYPIIGNMPTLARLLGVPYVPITPTWPWLGLLGLVPLPSKWLIEFGEPIATDDHGEGGAEDPMLVFDLTDQVRETIQQTLYSLLVSRRSVFF